MITGPNGTGKTSVLEALAYLGTRRSFRGAPPEAMVRTGATSAIVRAEHRLGATARPWSRRRSSPAGRSRTRVNRKHVAGRKELGAAAPCTIFSPEDLTIISGGPQGPARPARRRAGAARRRRRPGGRRDRARPAPARRAAAPVRRAGTARTWPRPSTCGTSGWPTPARSSWRRANGSWPTSRTRSASVYARLAGAGGPGARATAATRGAGRETCSTPWPPAAPTTCGGASTRSGPTATTCCSQIDGREARTHASQGEQRCLALALRLGVHALVRARTPLVPTLLLDDVFSELDPARSRALVAELPAGQSILTTATPAARGDRRGPDAPGRRPRGPVSAAARATRAPGRSASRCRGCWPVSGASPTPALMDVVFTRWEEVVGAELGGHLRPLRVDGRALVVAADHPAWATRARMESAADPGPGEGARERPRSTAWRSSSSAPDRATTDPTGDRSRVPNWHVRRVEWCVRIERPEVTVRGFDTHREDRRSERARLWQ